MGRVQVKDNAVQYVVGEATYYVKEHFDPSFDYSLEKYLHGRGKSPEIPETFFSYGPIEKIVSLLGQGRANVVQIKLSNELALSAKDIEQLSAMVGPKFYFSRSCYDYNTKTLPHSDTEMALGFQVVLDIIVRNWDDGERNLRVVDGVPVFFDFGASLAPLCKNIYRFLLKLDEAAKVQRVSSITRYFTDYSRRRSNILRKAIRVFQAVPSWEIRAIANLAEPRNPAYFGEYLAQNIFNLAEDVDILRGAFLRCPPKATGPATTLEEKPSILREGYFRQTK